MKLKPTDLTDRALDWAVALCNNFDDNDKLRRHPNEVPKYSKDWAEAGPIIVREEISLNPSPAIRSTTWKQGCVAWDFISLRPAAMVLHLTLVSQNLCQNVVAVRQLPYPLHGLAEQEAVLLLMRLANAQRTQPSA